MTANAVAITIMAIIAVIAVFSRGEKARIPARRSHRTATETVTGTATGITEEIVIADAELPN